MNRLLIIVIAGAIVLAVGMAALIFYAPAQLIPAPRVDRPPAQSKQEPARPVIPSP
jgi:hypothetical protein